MTLKTITSDTINKLISQANTLHLQKEDILTVLNTPSGYVLIFFDAE